MFMFSHLYRLSHCIVLQLVQSDINWCREDIFLPHNDCDSQLGSNLVRPLRQSLHALRTVSELHSNVRL